VNQVEVDVLKLKLLKGCTEGTLNIVFMRLPQLSGNKDFFALDSRSPHLLKGFTDDIFVAIDSGGVDVSVAMLEDSIPYNFL